MPALSPPIRATLVYATFAVSLVYLLTHVHEQDFSWKSLIPGPAGTDVFVDHLFSQEPSLEANNIPDFSRYQHLQTLFPAQFPLDDPNRRVIIVGDLHGKIKSLHQMLQHVKFDPKKDTLVHTGDFVSRSPLRDSLATIEYMSTNNVTGVRGNHDQNVLEWRGWLEWIHVTSGGSAWLSQEEANWKKAHAKGIKLKIWNQRRRNECTRHECIWWNRLPHSWRLFGDHYQIAKQMSRRDHNYLLALPLKIHIPAAHAFIIHAGLLSSDPRYPPNHGKQPLARRPSLTGPGKDSENIDLLRGRQEFSILTQLPQNADPWVNLNLRSLRDDQPTRGQKGLPWSEWWNHDMGNCGGYATPGKHDSPSRNALPCYPSTVVYGHAASRGLDIKRWTVGLDSGCVYGNSLSALVLGGSPIEEEPEDDASGEGDEWLQAQFAETHNQVADYKSHQYNDEPDLEVDSEDEDMMELQDDSDSDVEDDSETLSRFMKKPEGKKGKGKTPSQPPKTPRVIRFGDNGKARVVSVPCH